MTPTPQRHSHWPAVIAGFLGWTLDSFDFFLVVLCLTGIGKDFAKSDKEVALSLTLTLAFRPIGAFLFGLIADRYGRRLPLIIDLVFYSIIEVATGFAPTFTTFLILRALFGIGMGGEWGVGASLAMEQVPPKWRGLLSGILQQGYAFGYLLASLAYLLLYDKWGWRPLFFIGGVPALLALYVRTKVPESEVWERGKGESWREVGRAIASNWKLFLYITLLMTGMNAASHGTQDMYPTFLQRFWHLGTHSRSAITAISMVGAIIGGTLVGFLSDRWGRRRALICSLLAAVAVIPLWAYSPGVAMLITGAFLMQLFVQGAWGVIPAHLSELAPTRVRGFLPGFGYQCGVLIAGSVAILEAFLSGEIPYSGAMAITAACAFLFAALMTALGHERRSEPFTD